MSEERAMQNYEIAKQRLAKKKREQVAEERARKRFKYYDYDLSTFQDTKGGYLAEEEQQGGNGAELRKVVFDPPIDPFNQDNAQCNECESLEIDRNYYHYYKLPICRTCIQANPETMSLLTKTEARQDYLLTECKSSLMLAELDDIPYWSKSNPHKSHWSSMRLYLRLQVEEFALKKWNNWEALDEEFEKREREKKERKGKKFKEKLTDLRKRTRTSVWKKEGGGKHEHEYGEKEYDEGKDVWRQSCKECGMIIEFEEM